MRPAPGGRAIAPDAALTYLFLDAEWADTLGCELVSLALVSEDGKHRFYAEADPLPVHPTDFVRVAVYPHLDRGATALRPRAMTQALRRFLAPLSTPDAISDFPNDLLLFQSVLDGDALEEHERADLAPLPKVCLTKMIKDDIARRVQADYFSAHPEAAARHHHAAVDAEALRMTWLALTGRTSAWWSPTLLAQGVMR